MGRYVEARGNNSFAIGLDGTGAVITANNTMAIMGGYVGINTSSPGTWRLKVNGTAGGTGSWQVDSDARLKTNVKPLESALQNVLKLQGVSFNWIDETNHRPGQNIGFIAQEVKEILPEIVSGGKDGTGNEIYYQLSTPHYPAC